MSKIYKFTFLFLLAVILGCSLHPKIKSEEAYLHIKPKAPLPESEQKDLPENLIITVDNVADMKQSYKNRLNLYVNNYLIKPDRVYNYKSSYKYELKLQPGIYDVTAKYFAHSGWAEKGFPIKTKEQVKVYLDKRTILTAKLEKNWWGAPIEKTVYFDVRYEPIFSK